jgi:glutaconate CoA-transferase subunit B
MHRVVTDLAVISFDDVSKSMKVEALHPGVTVEQIRDNTGFDILIDDKPKVTPSPTDEELAVLRELDPEKLYTA